MLAADVLLVGFFAKGTGLVSIAENPLPGDAAIVDVFYDGRNVCFVVESAEYTPVAAHDLIPEAEPILFRTDDAR